MSGLLPEVCGWPADISEDGSCAAFRIERVASDSRKQDYLAAANLWRRVSLFVTILLLLTRPPSPALP